MEIELKRRNLKGEDNHRAFSIRLPAELCDKLDEIAQNANISRNELIKVLLEEGVKVVRVKD